MDPPAAPAAEDQQAALQARADEMVFKMMARMEAGEDVRNTKTTRKLVRLSREECEKIMAYTPWPPVIPEALSPDRCDAIKDPEGREKMWIRMAGFVEKLKVVHAEWTRIHEQYAAQGFAKALVDVDEHGVESFAPAAYCELEKQ